jgi:O-succinylbenzoate synthase
MDSLWPEMPALEEVTAILARENNSDLFPLCKPDTTEITADMNIVPGMTMSM